jgi:hypothetical protein
MAGKAAGACSAAAGGAVAWASTDPETLTHIATTRATPAPAIKTFGIVRFRLRLR